MDPENTCEWSDIGCHLDWLTDEIKYICMGMWEWVLSGVAAMYESIPVPDFMTQLSENNFVFPPFVLFWTDFFQVPFGLTVFASALTLRFILRRMPVIG